MEESMEAGMRNFMRAGYKGVTETWNILQHEVSWEGRFPILIPCVVSCVEEWRVFCLQND